MKTLFFGLSLSLNSTWRLFKLKLHLLLSLSLRSHTPLPRSPLLFVCVPAGGMWNKHNKNTCESQTESYSQTGSIRARSHIYVYYQRAGFYFWGTSNTNTPGKQHRALKTGGADDDEKVKTEEGQIQKEENRNLFKISVKTGPGVKDNLDTLKTWSFITHQEIFSDLNTCEKNCDI